MAIVTLNNSSLEAAEVWKSFSFPICVGLSTFRSSSSTVLLHWANSHWVGESRDWPCILKPNIREEKSTGEKKGGRKKTHKGEEVQH